MAWQFSGYPCDLLLRAKIRLQLEYYAKDAYLAPLFTDEVKKKLMSISASTIDKRLKCELKNCGSRAIGNAATHQRSCCVVERCRICRRHGKPLRGIGIAANRHVYNAVGDNADSGCTEVRSLPNRAHKATASTASLVACQAPIEMSHISVQ